MGKVTGVGGIFQKARDAKALLAWYVEHLGLPAASDGSSVFEGPGAQGMTVFSFFAESSKYFGDGEQRTMVNFRVDSLDEVLARLTAAGTWVDPHREDAPYGRFAWFRDPEGNRVELWEPPSEDATQE
jgi:catechol 2,3-dioxygenase-like lactoylglutathione lyase family enzyme